MSKNLILCLFLCCQAQQGCWCTCRATATAAASTYSAGDLWRTTAAICIRQRPASAARAAAAEESWPTHPPPAARKRARFSGKCLFVTMESLSFAAKPHTNMPVYNFGGARHRSDYMCALLLNHFAFITFFGHPPVGLRSQPRRS